MKVVYIGPFPITGGGVTNKNRDLYEALSIAGMQIEKIDLHKITKRKSTGELVRLFGALIDRSNVFIIGVSTGNNTRRNFTRLLYFINRKSMKKSIILVMGGIDDKNIAKDSAYKKVMSCFKRVYVETEGMRENLEAAGMQNVAVYPNCRFRPQYDIPMHKHKKPLRCVFFSSVQPEKGVDIVLEAANILPEVEFDIYGNVTEGCQATFTAAVNDLPNVKYQGIFKGSSDNTYAVLSQYDILLFPTKWDTEGVPGILVEGKIAGLAEIVSNRSHNAELITDGIDGMVLYQNTSCELVKVIKELDNNDVLLQRMRLNSKKSGEKYYIENNIANIIDNLGGYKETDIFLFPYFLYQFTAAIQSYSVLRESLLV